jgi:Ni,Fe-hydrogenase III large subunit
MLASVQILPIIDTPHAEDFYTLINRDLSSGGRLSMLESIDGKQLLALIGSTIYKHDLSGLTVYKSLTRRWPQARHHEAKLSRIFGLVARDALPERVEVQGQGIFEIPVGPVHAGIIEPGHFRLSCVGEKVLDIDLRLGYVHRDIEGTLAKSSLQQLPAKAEAIAGDTIVANAIAAASIVEALQEQDITISPQSNCYRLIALEIERMAMHLADLGGMAQDLGMGAMAARFGVFRGKILRVAELLSGNRFLKGFVYGDRQSKIERSKIEAIINLVLQARREMLPVMRKFCSELSVAARLEGLGALSRTLAQELDVVGLAARAAGISCDSRVGNPIYESLGFVEALEQAGDAYARTQIRRKEIEESSRLTLAALDRLLMEPPLNQDKIENIKIDRVNGRAILARVEAFRGELLHLAITDDAGEIIRYAVRDPSNSNWPSLALAMKNQIVQNFPVCNKSFGLSYGGHDL